MKLEFSVSALVAITNYHRLGCFNKQTNKMLISQARILRSGSQHGGVLGESPPSGLETAVFLLYLHMVEKDQLDPIVSALRS